jgi:hypothetical protein
VRAICHPFGSHLKLFRLRGATETLPADWIKVEKSVNSGGLGTDLYLCFRKGELVAQVTLHGF